MIQLLLKNRKFTGLICAVLLTVESLRHLLFLTGALSYKALWGVAVKVNTAVTAGEAISLALLLIFDAAVIVLMRWRFIRVQTAPSGRKHRRFRKAPTLAVIACRVATVASALYLLGYLRAGTMGLRIGMGLYTAVLTVLLILFQLWLARDEKRAFNRFTQLKNQSAKKNRKRKKKSYQMKEKRRTSKV